MKRNFFLILAIVITACSTTPAQVTLTSEVAVTLPPVSPTPEPTATPEPQLPIEIQEKFDKAGIDIKNMKNATLDANGLQITFEDNEVITIPASELDARTTVRRDGTFQVLDSEGKNIEIAFDKQNNTFELKSDYVYFPEDKKIDINVLKKVAPEDKLESYRMEKLFFADYPEDVFQPDPDRINNQVGDVNIFKDQNPEGKYPASTPLGPGASEMLRLENIFIIEKDPANGRPYDTVYITQSMALNGQLEVMHFAYDLATEFTFGVVQDLVSSRYIVPINAVQKDSYNNPNKTTFRMNYELNELTLSEQNGAYYFEFDEIIIESLKFGENSPKISETEMQGLGFN